MQHARLRRALTETCRKKRTNSSSDTSPSPEGSILAISVATLASSKLTLPPLPLLPPEPLPLAFSLASFSRQALSSTDPTAPEPSVSTAPNART